MNWNQQFYPSKLTLDEVNAGDKLIWVYEERKDGLIPGDVVTVNRKNRQFIYVKKEGIPGEQGWKVDKFIRVTDYVATRPSRRFR